MLCHYNPSLQWLARPFYRQGQVGINASHRIDHCKRIHPTVDHGHVGDVVAAFLYFLDVLRPVSPAILYYLSRRTENHYPIRVGAPGIQRTWGLARHTRQRDIRPETKCFFVGDQLQFNPWGIFIWRERERERERGREGGRERKRERESERERKREKKKERERERERA